MRHINVVIACVVLILLCGWFYHSAPWYSKVYYGLKWTCLDNEAYEEVKVSFSGMKNDSGEFEGNILISSDDGVIYNWEDIIIVRMPLREREYFICPSDANLDTDGDGQIDLHSCVFGCYAMMFADEEWNQISIALANFDEDGNRTGISHETVVTVPVATLKEAMTITENLSEGTHLEFVIGNRLDD